MKTKMLVGWLLALMLVAVVIGPVQAQKPGWNAAVGCWWSTQCPGSPHWVDGKEKNPIEPCKPCQPKTGGPTGSSTDRLTTSRTWTASPELSVNVPTEGFLPSVFSGKSSSQLVVMVIVVAIIFIPLLSSRRK